MSKAIHSGSRTVSLSDFKIRAARVAQGFFERRVADGAVVALMLRNDIAFLEAMVGARLAGAYGVPINWHFTGEETGYILRDCDARVLVVHADLLPAIASAIPADVEVMVVETPPEIADAYRCDPLLCAVPGGAIDWNEWVAAHPPATDLSTLSRGSMFYTSGTTGAPKGVRRAPQTEARRGASVAYLSGAFGMTADMRVAITGPMYHSAPNAYAAMALERNSDVWLMSRFDPEALLEAIDIHKLTHMHVVPTMFVRLLHLPEEVRARYDISSLRCVIHGAAPCPPEIKRRMIEWWGPVIWEYYGSTEASIVSIAKSEDALARPGTVGPLLAGVSARIVGEDGAELPPGEAGEIYLKNENAADFTYNKRDEDRRAIELDGYVTNGDVGYFDADGYLFISDRKRDMVISGGVNIYPVEIEAVLIAHPAVRDCAVFGIPDEEFGEALAAAAELKSGESANVSELHRFLGERLAAYKIPRIIEFHDSLPREDSGKIYKRKLREPFWADAARQI